MAYLKQYVLTGGEKRILRMCDMGDEIGSESRKMNRRIQRRLDNWTTCPRNYFGYSDISILLFGMGGVGKSALANLLLGNDNAFKICNSGRAETNRVSGKTGWHQGNRITVYDTPGYLMRDLLTGEASPFKALKMGVRDIDEGVHVIMIVFSATKMRTLDSDIQLLMKANLLNAQSFRYCMLVVTHSESCYRRSSVYDYISHAKQSPEFCELIGNIGYRVVLVESGCGDLFDEDNLFYSAEKESGRDMIFNMVYKVVDSNYGRCYMTNDIEKDLRTCFPPLATVITPDGSKTMQDLTLNDDVLVYHSQRQLQYEKVIMFSHANPSLSSYFCTISTEDGKVLQLSPGHLLHVGEIGKLTAAQDVEVGDVVFTCDGDQNLNPAQIATISGEWLTGIYCPHTPSGSIIVDGVAASCYTNLLSPTLAHAFMLPVCVAQRLLPDDWFKWMVPYNEEQGMPSLALRVSKILKWA